MSEQKPRQIAARLLLRRRAGAGYLEDLLDAEPAARGLAPADRGLLQELVFGVGRRQLTLDWLIARKTAPGRTQKDALRVLLQLGLYQMFWLDRVPDHAAVHETVELTKTLGLGPQAGFVNAVLRGYARERETTQKLLAELKITEPPLGYSHPEWLYQRWLARWGAEKTAQLMDWNNTPPPVYARVNTLKTDAAKLTARWNTEGVKFTETNFDWTGPNLVFRLDAHPSLAMLGSFQDGLFYIQDPSTLLAVRELGPHPGETVLDLCAAPGGKTTFIAQLMENRGTILALDNHPDRLRLIGENCQRLGITCVETGSVSDQSQISSHQSQVSRVLVDAPCSNTGVMRRRVDLRWRIRPEEIERLRKEQLELLTQAVKMLKPGGMLVYSTCSLEPEENGQVVAQFLAAYPNLKLKTERELLPFADGVDGAYVAKMSVDH